MTALITENNLDHWVGMKAQEAQGLVVDLVYRLILASSPRPELIRLPQGDSINQPGPDAELKAVTDFNPYVPSGHSYWEIGTSAGARSKATEDYKKLTAVVPAEIRRDATFIFVTPRSGSRDWNEGWNRKSQSSWLRARRQKGEWKAVEVIDGTKLVAWAQHFPAVELWLAGQIHGFKESMIDIPEQHWKILKSTGEPPPLNPELFLSSRDDARAELRKLFGGQTSQLKLATHYPNSAIDFVCAHIASMDDQERLEIGGRCIIVTDGEVWKNLCAGNEKLFLIAGGKVDLNGDDGRQLIQVARNKGHAVIFAGPQGGIPEPAKVALPMPREEQVQAALVNAGYGSERARRLARLASGDLSVLLRCILNLAAVPQWADKSEAGDLAIAELMGAWNEAYPGDKVIAEGLSGKTYGEWIKKIREVAAVPAAPLIYQNGKWKFLARYQGWISLGRWLYDDDLDRFSTLIVEMFCKYDPKFELPLKERYAAHLYGKHLDESDRLRVGLAETLALLGSFPEALTSASNGKPKALAEKTVRTIMAGADWKVWASVNGCLPLFAEAAPEAFLEAVSVATQRDTSPFRELFAQEGDGITGGSLITGTLWALETLAWSSDYLISSILCLGGLAEIDPGGKWANRPKNSLSTILLPWLPQTTASVEKRYAAVVSLLKEFPKVGWEILLSLLPEHRGISSGSRRPAWRRFIPDEWKDGVSKKDYATQVVSYANLAIEEAKRDINRLSALLSRIENLPEESFYSLVSYLDGRVAITYSDEQKLKLWLALSEVVTKHKRFSDAKWALSTDALAKLSAVNDKIAPQAPELKHQRLFADRDFGLYEEKGSYDDQRRILEGLRRDAIAEVFSQKGVEGVLQFAESVESSRRVGLSFGGVAPLAVDKAILSKFLRNTKAPMAEFARGFVVGRFVESSWEWADTLFELGLSNEVVVESLVQLPFTTRTWALAKRLLGGEETLYWKRVEVWPYQADADLDFAVERLLSCGRPHAAIRCLSGPLYAKKTVNLQKAAEVLKAALRSDEPRSSLDVHEVIELIKQLQSNPTGLESELLEIEWNYLPLLEPMQGSFPVMLDRRLAEDPTFFMEAIRSMYRSRNESLKEVAPIDEKSKSVASNSFDLLRKWRTPPGVSAGGSFEAESFKHWILVVEKLSKESGHFEVAMNYCGQVLTHAPPDPSGLWIHREVASVLDQKEMDVMRAGFSVELRNARGVFQFSNGKQEREIARGYIEKAESVELAGYSRLATVLRKLAEAYERDAEHDANRDVFERD